MNFGYGRVRESQQHLLDSVRSAVAGKSAESDQVQAINQRIDALQRELSDCEDAFHQLDLSRLDFSGIDLTGLDFFNVNLEGAILRDADVQWLAHSNLRDADLTRAN